MNPFDWTGPAFLGFYFVLGVAVHAAFKPFARAAAGGPPAGPSPIDLSHVDPYVVAYLRGQENETARVAALALIDRRLLVRDDDSLIAVPGAAANVRRPLERAVLEAFPEKAKAATLFSNDRFKTVVQGCRAQLERLGLLVGESGRAKVFALRFVLIVFLLAVSVTKISVAFGRGRHNVGFLVFLTAAFVIMLAARPVSPRTELGDFTLDTLRTAFGGLKDRSASIRPGGGTAELSLLLGVFGLGALAGAFKNDAELLFPTAMKRAAAGGVDGSSCGSSCGSSSCGSSSCGGGGGCGGGGCGGCGG